MALLGRLRHRERIAELMDDPAIDPVAHRRALAALARINRFSASSGLLWPSIRNLGRRLGRPIRLLDIATGSGDIPAGILAKARHARLPLEVSGCDISPNAIAAARSNCPDGRFFVHDVIRAPLPGRFDVVTCSLFLHHLADEDAVTVLGHMKDAAEHAVLVNDLARSRFNYLLTWLACNLLTRSPIVRFDGPASVRSAYIAKEALAIAGRAGLGSAKVRSRFPCRFLLSWQRP
jgi:2-polyprenyl-3-methyl-5-hydroxy-6-metoxy-1,4-benzoquinol methylase